ncbi:hypothetical protein WJX77_003238 [Trebouxia sp. C0004]
MPCHQKLPSLFEASMDNANLMPASAVATRLDRERRAQLSVRSVQKREKLGTINTYTCKECGIHVCLKHRFPETHQCPGKSASLASAAGARALHLTQSMRSLWGRTMNAPTQQPAQQHQLKSVTQSVQSTQQPPQSAGVRQKSQSSRPQPASVGAQQAERCLDCGAGFTNVQELIRHSESVHQHSRPQPVQRHQPDSCPHCGKMFPDAVALVRHIKHSHGDNAQCVLC